MDLGNFTVTIVEDVGGATVPGTNAKIPHSFTDAGQLAVVEDAGDLLHALAPPASRTTAQRDHRYPRLR